MTDCVGVGGGGGTCVCVWGGGGHIYGQVHVLFEPGPELTLWELIFSNKP